MGYVVALIEEVLFVADAVREEARLPDGAGVLFTDGVGETAFDALDAAFDGVASVWG